MLRGLKSAGQDRTEQYSTEQNRTEQNRTEHDEDGDEKGSEVGWIIRCTVAFTAIPQNFDFPFLFGSPYRFPKTTQVSGSQIQWN